MYMNISSAGIANLAPALAAAQAEVENATKNAANPHFRSKYADLAEILNTVRPVFTRHGIAIVQSPSCVDGIVSVETMLLHKSGEYLVGTVSAPVKDNSAQAVGSAVTYCRRYALAAMAGVAQEDDDGEKAMGRRPDKSPEPKSPPVGTGALLAEIATCESTADLRGKMTGWRESLPEDQQVAIVGAVQARMADLARDEAAKMKKGGKNVSA